MKCSRKSTVPESPPLSSRQAAEEAVALTKEEGVLWDSPRRLGKRRKEEAEADRADDLQTVES